jgi:ribosome hibernation promoting factor
LRLNITGRHFDIDDEIKEFVDKKSEKLSKYSSKIIELRVVIEPNKHHFTVEAVVIAKNLSLHSESRTEDIYSAIDSALKKVERQLSHIKDKITDKHQAMKSKNAEAEKVVPDEEEEEVEE